MQFETTLQSDHTVSVTAAAASGTALTYIIPPLSATPADTWFTFQGSQIYVDTAAPGGTMYGSDGVTYTWARDSSGDIVIHSNDGSPDCVLPASMVVARSQALIQTAGVGCNAASFAVGFFGAGIVLGAVASQVEAGGKGGGKVAASVVALLKAMYDYADYGCHQGW
jgi:hypothetical protein